MGADNTTRPATAGGDVIRDDAVTDSDGNVVKTQAMVPIIGGDGADRGRAWSALPFQVQGRASSDLLVDIKDLLEEILIQRAIRATSYSGASVDGPYLGALAGLVSSGFDPATLNLSGWWRTNYTGAPWLASASAGISGTTGNLIAGTAPSTGTALNGFTPPDFNGTTQKLVNANNMASLFGATQGTIVGVYAADTAAAVAPNPFDDPNLFTDTVGVAGLKFCDQGIGGYIFDGVGYTPPCDVFHAAGAAYHAVRMRWDTVVGFMGITLDSGLETQVVLSAIATGSMGTILAGTNFASAAFFDGRLPELLTMPTAMTNPEWSNFKSYANARYLQAF